MSAESPTLTSGSTEVGVLLGTAAYMSPEQARGDSVDRRTDIWAFGCVMYEALTGERAFQGRTMSDTIAAVLREEPDWTRLAETTPPKLQRLIRRCLQKNAHVRLHDIADARIEIDETSSDPRGALESDRPPPRWLGRTTVVATAVAAMLVGAFAMWGLMRSQRQDGIASTAALARLMMALPAEQALEKSRFTSLALSSDGRQLVYAAGVRGGQTRLFLRRIDELAATPIAGTEGANTPFFSPDGRWLAFYSDGALKKVSLSGGVPLTIAETPPVWSASWAANDIVFATTLTPGLWRVSADGGEPAQITEPKEGDTQHGYPQILPDESHVLFSVRRGNGWQLAIASLAPGEWQLLGGGRAIGEGARYVPTGHVVAVQSGGLVVTPFDASTRQLGTSPVPLLERVETSRFGGANFAVAGDGTLVYLPASGVAARRTLVRLGRDGSVAPLVDARAAYEHPRISPDGKRIAVTVASETGSDIWTIDVERGTRIRVTSGDTSAFPVWAPDDSRLAYQSTAAAPWNLFSRSLTRGDEPQPLIKGGHAGSDSWSNSGMNLLPGTLPTLSGGNPQFPTTWAKQQSVLAFHERKPNGERDIWVVGADGSPSPFLLTPFDERAPAFSPDGKWLAYASNESGQDEVYVQPFPGPGPKWLLSTDGGTDPVWSRDGREVFYRHENGLMAVGVTTSDTLSASRPRPVVESRFEEEDNGPNYDVSPDGRWFVVPRSDQAPAPAQLHVVFNWFSEITARGKAVQ
jgi:serine/threonine-protein kinase